ncbi:MAG TPA: immunoglobulin domain-containing protein, partial [Chitinispirillaceae bacterium]|nr:immunoglobulin domain-containing protein [Chitinispirillaceae bacterium]
MNEVAITGATKDTLVFNGLSAANDSDSVHCVVRNPLGSSVTSKMARLTVSSATQILKIIREPESSVNISVGGSLSLQVDAQGSGTISYTWYKNGLAATDSVGTGKKYYKTSVSASDSGVYRCVAKNSFGLDTSVAVTVKVTTETPVKLINPITIECTYTAQTDTVNVSLKKIPSGTVRDSIVSMLLFYGSETFGFVWDTVPVAEFPLADSLFIVYKNEKFLSDQQTITVNVFLRGINSMLSDTVSKTLQVGINRPQNTIALSVKEAHERSIDLEWTMINESADSIRIWTGKEPVPLTFNPNSLQYTPLTVGGGIRSLSVENLDTNTHYYFAAQIKKDVLWSTITATSRTDKFTLGSADTRKVQNAIKVINTSFDTIANALSVRWSVDSTGISGFNLQAAVCFSVLTYPLAGPGLGDSIIESVNLHYENVTTIPWIGSKIFDTTYYISMFLRNKTASWSDTAAAAQDTIFIPKAKKESVTLFKVDGDSVYALNRTILIRKGKNWSPTSIVITNEIRLDTVPGTTNGFITVSSPFRFEKGEQTSDIEIGMRYNTLPGEFSANDVYMYVYKNGNWRLLNRIAVDADARMIFANFPIGDATDIMLPHLLMIDIAAPRVVLSDSNEAIEPNEDYVCPISVADNIANAVCTLKCGMINKPLEVVKIIPLTDTTFGGFLSISSSEFPIKSENSFRILLTVTDHHNSKVYDLSKQVVKSDNVVTYSDMTWVPVSTTAILNKPSMDQAFKEICDGNEWKYDSLKFRIFKWHTSVNSAKDGYIEYSGDRPDIFDVVPGKVFWLKKRGGGTFNLGDGKTVSISDPFKITLPAQQWTDFAMPYDIQLSLADIFNTSGIGPEEQKTIWFFKFDASISGKQAVLSPVYYPVLGDNGPISDIVLSQGSYTAYTIYNSTQTEQVLTIPPIDKSYSTITSSVLAKKADDDNWYIKIESSSKGDISAPVYCVFKKYGSGISKYPSPPYPGSVRVGILDSIERKTYGTIVLNDDRMGYSVPLYITNSSKTESKTVTYSLSSSKPGKSGNLAVYNAETGKLESGSGSCSSYSVYLEPQGHAYRWALAGDS